MKRLNPALAFFLTAMMAAAPAAKADEPIVLRIADTYPPSHYVVRFATSYWMEEVTKRAHGMVKFEYYGGGQLGKLANMLNLATTGVTDIAYVAPSATTDKMPLSEVAELPGGFQTSCQGTLAYYALATKGILANSEYKRLGITLLFAALLSPYQILSREKFASLADLKGQKLRAAGGPQDMMLRLLNIVPLQVPATEQYDALSRKTIDGTIYPLTAVPAYDLQTVLKYSTEGLNFGSGTIAYIIPTKKLDGLPEELRTIMLDVGKQTTDRACHELEKDSNQTAHALAEKGMSFVTLPSADEQHLAEISNTVSQEWAKRLDDRGLKGSETVEEFRKAVDAVH